MNTAEIDKAEPSIYRRVRFFLKDAPKLPLLVIVLFLFCASFADLLPLHNPNLLNLTQRFLPPAWMEGGNATFLLGTDSLGRDVLSRLVHGARISAILAVMVIFVSLVIGGGLGMISGYFGGMVDLVVARVIDASLTVPTVFAALLLVVILGPGFSTLVVALVIFLWARFARVLRGEALRFREKGFIKRARIVGCSPPRILLLHMAPNLLDTALILATINFGYVMVAEASLSFLGLGLPPPTATWGQMVSEGRDHLAQAPWLSLIPGLTIMVVVLAFSLLGDWVRDRLDPHSELRR